jgi:GxxExxY protein
MSVLDFLYKEECYKILGCAMEVHKELGPGFLEAVYQEALSIELASSFVNYEKEKIIDISYKGEIMAKKYIADFVCNEGIIVELKAVNSLKNEHFAQVLNYLKATDLRIALLINFGSKSLEFKRIIS